MSSKAASLVLRRWMAFGMPLGTAAGQRVLTPQTFASNNPPSTFAKIDTSRFDAQPYVIDDRERAFFSRRLSSLKVRDIAKKFGEDPVRWHFAGSGTKTLPPLWQFRLEEHFTTLDAAVQEMRIKKR